MTYTGQPSSYYPSFRLYYPGGKAGSFGTLAAGFRNAFEVLGIKHALCDYRDTPDEDGFGRAGSGYDIGLYLGEPSHLSAIALNTAHKERLVMVAPNGLGIPWFVVKDCKGFGCDMVAPSQWGADVIEKATGKRPEVIQHGVYLPSGMTEEEIEADDKRRLASSEQAMEGRRKVKLLHVTSTATDRKGTITLLRVFAADLWQTCHLTIKTDPEAGRHIKARVDALDRMARECVHVDTSNYPNDGAMFRFYREHDLVVQPSAAEGFGMPSLEGACAGVPSLMSFVTGHVEFCESISAWHWEHSREPGFLAGEDFDGYPPLESADDALFAISRLWSLTGRANQWRVATAKAWSWPAVVEKWLKERI